MVRSSEEFLLFFKLKLLLWNMSLKYPPESRETKEIDI